MVIRSKIAEQTEIIDQLTNWAWRFGQRAEHRERHGLDVRPDLQARAQLLFIAAHVAQDETNNDVGRAWLDAAAKVLG